MKKIIDGKRYNTETATQIAEWDNGIYGGDFQSCEESLYKTPNGSYFIAGSGGAMSKYAEPYGNNGRCGGSDITPVDREDAFQWLCEKGFEDEAEEEFSDMIDDA